jgi:hypothetical protein
MREGRDGKNGRAVKEGGGGGGGGGISEDGELDTAFILQEYYDAYSV